MTFYFKATCNIRPYFLAPMGGLRIEGPLYLLNCATCDYSYRELQHWVFNGDLQVGNFGLCNNMVQIYRNIITTITCTYTCYYCRWFYGFIIQPHPGVEFSKEFELGSLMGISFNILKMRVFLNNFSCYNGLGMAIKAILT